jgi:hypothetical protein
LTERKSKIIAQQGIDAYEASDLGEIERELNLIHIQQAISKALQEVSLRSPF